MIQSNFLGIACKVVRMDTLLGTNISPSHSTILTSMDFPALPALVGYGLVCFLEATGMSCWYLVNGFITLAYKII